MEAFFADETSISWDEHLGFFMYGGITLNALDLKTVTKETLRIKKEAGVNSLRPVKWKNVNWGGDTLPTDVHRQVKHEILQIFSQTDSKIIICLSPHRFYHDTTFNSDGNRVMRINPVMLNRTQRYAMNDLLEKFESYLGNDKQGIIVADKFGEAVRHDLSKHCFESFPYNQQLGTNNIIHRVFQVAEEESEPLQVSDIVLGAIQHSLKDSSRNNFLPILRQNFWANQTETRRIVSGYGFNVYPLAPKYPSYQRAVENLKIKFRRLINE